MMFSSLLPTITGGGSLIALVLLWLTDYYVEFIEATIYVTNATL
ncbi:ACD_00350 [African swine fever virus]